MSQEQPRRPQTSQSPQQEPFKYGDVFDVSNQLASKPITPKDATMMQSAENQVLGQTQKSGPAAVMQSAATANMRAGLVGREDISSKEGVSVSETKVGANRVITEAVGRDVVGQCVEPNIPMNTPSSVLGRDAITIGEALEATAISPAGDKPVELSDAAAIQAAEVRATGLNEVMPGGVGAEAQSAATRNNARNLPFQEKTSLSDVLAVMDSLSLYIVAFVLSFIHVLAY